jgi:DnaJ-class molecular chaperone
MSPRVVAHSRWPIACPYCHGDGFLCADGAGPATCVHCGGAGVVRESTIRSNSGVRVHVGPRTGADFKKLAANDRD